MLPTWPSAYVAGLTATRWVGPPDGVEARDGINRWAALGAAACLRAAGDAARFGAAPARRRAPGGARPDHVCRYGSDRSLAVGNDPGWTNWCPRGSSSRSRLAGAIGRSRRRSSSMRSRHSSAVSQARRAMRASRILRAPLPIGRTERACPASERVGNATSIAHSAVGRDRQPPRASGELHARYEDARCQPLAPAPQRGPIGLLLVVHYAPGNGGTPTTHMTAIRSLPGAQHWREAGKWLLWGCVLGLAPVWISSLIFVILGQTADTASLFDQGQLALYAAAMAGTAIYLASIDREPPGMKFRTTIVLIAVTSTLIAIAVYATTQAVDVVTDAQGSHFDLPSVTIIVVSLAVYIASLIASFLATLIDNERLSLRYTSLQSGHEDDLRDTFRGLGQ